MTTDEAFRILELDTGVDPAAHRAELHEAREKLAHRLQTAPDEEHAERYRHELAEFDEALEVVRHVKVKRSIGSRLLAALLVLLLITAAVGYVNLRWQQHHLRQVRAEVESLNTELEPLVEQQQWEPARAKYQRILELQPDSSVAAYGLQKVEAAIEQERQAFLGQWHDAATQAFEAKDWDEAESAAKTLLAKYPADAEARDMQKRVAQARKDEALQRAIAEGRAKLQARDWDGAVAAAEAGLAVEKDHAGAKALRDEALAAKQQAAANRLKARELFAKAKSADQGKYDKQLVESLKEAKALTPDDAEIEALLAKVSAYHRTLRVPGDFATPAEAMADLQDQDVLLIGAGVWQGPLVIDQAVEIRGSDAATTIIECPATESCAISFGPGAKGVKVGGITFRHRETDPGSERYSAALVRGGEVSFQDCVFAQAGGHGLMAVEGGKAVALRCKFTGNGWDGAAASGAGTSLEVRDSEASGNSEHGLDVWNEAAGIFTGNQSSNNGRNGLQLDAGTAAVTATGNQLRGNREFGLVLQSAASGRVAGNTLEANLLGGMAIRLAAAKVEVAKNRVATLAGPALVVEKGLPVAPLRDANELPAAGTTVQEVDFALPLK